ncbi:MAG: glycine betaine ABC transporter substrate-binding protein [Planctomycetota bacterium]
MLLALSASLCAQTTIRVGSKKFAESAILAELMAQMIEQHTELTVERRLNLQGTMLCWQALQSGEIDLYAEYTGTGWATIVGRTDKVTDPLRAFFEVRRFCRDEHDVHWLEPFGLNNTYALAMREDRAVELGVSRISDLIPHQASLRAGFGGEFGERADGYRGLQQVYGLQLGEVRVVEHALGYEAIAAGQLDLMDVYSTDGKLLRFELRVLEDDRRFFPPYNAAPMVRGATLRQHPEIEGALGRLAFRLPDHDAQALNYLVEAEGFTARQVARAFLEVEQLVEGLEESVAAEKARAAFLRVRRAPPAPGAAAAQRPGFFGTLQRSWGKLGERVLQHLLLTLAAVGLACALAIPLGVRMAAAPRLRAALLAFAGVVQTIPSLALLVFLIPLFGLSAWSAITALFLYALLPILRNTCTGILGVPMDLVDAARGMGMRDHEILWKVQLPLAMPTILAGVRTATVISIGFAVLAAFIGAGGLGGFIVDGLALNDMSLLLLGAMPAAALAVLGDRLLGLLERALSPRL